MSMYYICVKCFKKLYKYTHKILTFINGFSDFAVNLTKSVSLLILQLPTCEMTLAKTVYRAYRIEPVTKLPVSSGHCVKGWFL